MLKTAVKRKFLTSPIDPLNSGSGRATLSSPDVSDAQNCGKMKRILRLRVATLSSLRACRMLKTVVKWTFWTSPSDPFATSCVAEVVKTGVFVVVVVVVLWCFCGGVAENWCFCGGGVVVFLWWCAWCFCGGVCRVMFCGGGVGGVFVVVW